MISFSRMVAVCLAGAMIAATLGTLCMLPASAAHAPMAGCHSHAPLHPQPSSYQCCVSRHPAALVANEYSSRPVVQAAGRQTAPVFHLTRASYSLTGPSAIAGSGGPPDIFALRI